MKRPALLLHLCLGAALVVPATVAGQAHAIVVFDNLNSTEGFNQFKTPLAGDAGSTQILSRGYAFSVGAVPHSITSIVANLYTIFPLTGLSTPQLELRSFAGEPGALLESMDLVVPEASASIEASYDISYWSLQANRDYWIGLNWSGPPATPAVSLFGWRVVPGSPPPSPVFAPGFTDLGFHQYVRDGSGSEAWWPSNQINTFRLEARPEDVPPVPAPVGFAALACGFSWSRSIKRRLESR